MKVYLLMRNYSDGSESTESVEKVYKDYDAAYSEADRLNISYARYNTYFSDVSYYVDEQEVW